MKQSLQNRQFLRYVLSLVSGDIDLCMCLDCQQIMCMCCLQTLVNENDLLQSFSVDHETGEYLFPMPQATITVSNCPATVKITYVILLGICVSMAQYGGAIVF